MNNIVEYVIEERDLIRRKEAIEALRNLPRWIMDPDGEFQPVDPPTVSMIDPDDAVSAIENLPTGLELITCKDCKYYVYGDDEDESYCRNTGIGETEDFYCADAERGNE